MRNAMIGLVLVAAGVAGCGQGNSTVARDPPQAPWIDVSCTLTVPERGEIALTFINDAQQEMRFLVGRGIPSLRVRRTRPKPLLQAGFTCLLAYVHDCFHAELIALAPGGSKTVNLRDARAGLASLMTTAVFYTRERAIEAWKGIVDPFEGVEWKPANADWGVCT